MLQHAALPSQKCLRMALPALNLCADDPHEHNTERVWATLPKELVSAIDDYHHGKRLRNRSVAVRELLERGLRAAAWEAQKKPKA